YLWFFDWPDHPGQFSTSFSPSHTYPDTGLYTVALIVNPGTPCADTALQQIHLTQSFVDAGMDVVFPDCDDNGLLIQGLDFSSDTIYGVMSWFWTLNLPNGSLKSSSQQNPVFDVNLPGNYQLRLIAKSFNGCRDTLIFPFTAPLPPLNLLPDEVAICLGDSVELYPQNSPLYQYAWSPAASLSDSTAASPFASPAISTTYSVTVSGNGPCVRTDSITVDVVEAGALEALANPDTIYQGHSSQLTASLPFNANFSWFPPNTLSNSSIATPEASPYETTTYTVTASLPGSCELTDSVRVVVIIPICEEPYVFFPTGFSPNNDGFNDALKPESRFIETLYWVIYNRWGEKVFETTDPEQAWDGTYKGQPLPAETFGYYIRVSCIGGEQWEKKGNVTLLR
ncbi:MAG TPA: gliding motility-associated C-terminal domain-containing protein, partial [Saprospiraceae bacterium]|nr:gliding motility-associated C-terminal domain-containing protein [Saprospiraceae bacterium]